jgi:excisionase family DNA binding protein
MPAKHITAKHITLRMAKVTLKNNEQSERLTLSVPEVARLLGISRNHAYAMARDRVYPVHALGRKLVIPKAKFMRWLNG